MKIQEKLEELLSYYEITRQSGHTTLMKKGTYAYDKDKFVLSHNMNHAKELGVIPNDVISLNNLEKLKGHRRPIAIDNGAMMTILSETLKEFDRLEEENKELRSRMIEMKKILTMPY